MFCNNQSTVCWTPKYRSVSEASECPAFRGQWLKTNFAKVFMEGNMECILLFPAELYWISMIFSQKNLWPRSTLTSVLIREVKRPSFRGGLLYLKIGVCKKHFQEMGERAFGTRLPPILWKCVLQTPIFKYVAYTAWTSGCFRSSLYWTNCFRRLKLEAPFARALSPRPHFQLSTTN